jgi:uncharacterized protein YgiM (DUF1202 family)
MKKTVVILMMLSVFLSGCGSTATKTSTDTAVAVTGGTPDISEEISTDTNEKISENGKNIDFETAKNIVKRDFFLNNFSSYEYPENNSYENYGYAEFSDNGEVVLEGIAGRLVDIKFGYMESEEPTLYGLFVANDKIQYVTKYNLSAENYENIDWYVPYNNNAYYNFQRLSGEISARKKEKLDVDYYYSKYFLFGYINEMSKLNDKQYFFDDTFTFDNLFYETDYQTENFLYGYALAVSTSALDYNKEFELSYDFQEEGYNIAKEFIENGTCNTDIWDKIKNTKNQAGWGYVATETTPLNMRKEPNTDSDILTVIPKEMYLDFYSATEDWYAVYYNGYWGYVLKEYVTIAVGEDYEC